MAEGTINYIAAKRGGERKTASERLQEALQRFLVNCPQCLQRWLVLGIRESDQHVCKSCGHRFAVKPIELRGER